MNARDGDTIDVRADEALDVARLEPYLRARLARADEPFVLRQFGGGHANLTYLVRFGAHEYVLRRPPLGPVAPGAHDMRREHRVLSGLYGGYPLAPRSYFLCTDHTVIGADFFVMERRHGIAFRQDVPAPWADRPEVLRGVGFTLIDNLAALHAVTPGDVGLGDLGKPDGYVERQVRGWIERWHNARTPDVEDGDAFTAWLGAHVPPARRTALLHNDYKLDNTLLDADRPDVTTAVLDWDMCTRGEPLMDLGYLIGLWAQAGEEPIHGRMPTWRAGFPTRREAVQRYAERSGADVSGLEWYVIFAVFRFAVILQQIYVRYVRGQTHDPRFANFGTAVNALLRRGAALCEGSRAVL